MSVLYYHMSRILIHHGNSYGFMIFPQNVQTNNWDNWAWHEGFYSSIKRRRGKCQGFLPFESGSFAWVVNFRRYFYGRVLLEWECYGVLKVWSPCFTVFVTVCAKGFEKKCVRHFVRLIFITCTYFGRKLRAKFVSLTFYLSAPRQDRETITHELCLINGSMLFSLLSIILPDHSGNRRP